jgi:hypothetical protein
LYQCQNCGNWSCSKCLKDLNIIVCFFCAVDVAENSDYGNWHLEASAQGTNPPGNPDSQQERQSDAGGKGKKQDRSCCKRKQAGSPELPIIDLTVDRSNGKNKINTSPKHAHVITHTHSWTRRAK